MTGEMGVLKKYEVEKLMKKLSRERKRVIQEFVIRNHDLAVGDERFQCFLSALPPTNELRELMGEDFDVRLVLNGWIIRRLR